MRLGEIYGARVGLVEKFLGIQYALAPVGPLRFRPALPVWSVGQYGQLNATRFGPTCHQPFAHGQFGMNVAEDCLMLNIWRPAFTTNTSALPVMVWIHGGEFTLGSTSLDEYDGSNLAQNQGVIVVSLQYRLGPLGFLAFQDPKKHEGTGGMNGIHDQIVALKFVRDYISDFGGNPLRTTVFGQSAGGLSVCNLLVSPLARGLFQRAILQSGPCIGSWAPGRMSDGQALAKQMMVSMNVTSIEEMRLVPAEMLMWPMASLMNLSFPAHWVDGWVMPTEPENLFRADPPELNAETILIGSVSMDGMMPFFGMDIPKKRDMFGPMMAIHWRKTTSQVMNFYNLTSFDLPQVAFVRADADANVVCPSLQLAGLLSSHAQVHHFAFQHGPRPNDPATHMLPQPVNETKLEWASHGADVPFVFGTAATNLSTLRYKPVERPHPAPPPPSSNFTLDETVLSNTMQSLWVGKTPFDWPIFNTNLPKTLILDTPSSLVRVVTDYRQSVCQFWIGDL